MTDRAHLILSCSNRKTAPVQDGLLLRSFKGPSRSERWIEKVSDSQGAVRASSLYAGEYWREGLALFGALSERQTTQLWILSAGFGLVSGDDLIAPYGATLAVGQEDSVAFDRADAQASNRSWMDNLARWAGPGHPRSPRTLGQLAALDSGARLIVCAGPAYLDSVGDDLRRAVQVLADPDRLLVFSSSSRPLSGLGDSWITVPGQLRMVLGGSMASTTVRAAQTVTRDLQRRTLDASAARTSVESMVSNAAPLPKYGGQRRSDASIRDWIMGHLEHCPSATKSTALRALRNQGLACEQRRFGVVFDLAKGAMQ